jgi:hypothetical protein
MSIKNIDIGVVLNDYESMVISRITGSLINWWLRFPDHGALQPIDDEIMPLVDSAMMDITHRIICNKIVSWCSLCKMISVAAQSLDREVNA